MNNLSCYFNVITITVPSYRMAVSTTYLFTAITATALNSLVLLSIWKTPSLHKPSFLLIANLAITDLIVGSIAEPLMALTNIAALKEWTNLFCDIWITGRAVGYLTGAMSLNTLTVISVDRLLAIKLKERYRSVVTMKRVALVIFAFWTSTCCFLVLLKTYIDIVVIILSVYLFVVVGTLTFCSVASFYSLRKLTSPVTPEKYTGAADNRQRSIRTDQSHPSPLPLRLPCTTSIFRVSSYKRSLNTMLVMLLILVLFYFPYFCALVTTAVIYKVVPNASHSQYRMLNYIFLTVGELIVFVNSSMNPVIYLWRLKDIRQGAKTTMRKILGRKTTETAEN